MWKLTLGYYGTLLKGYFPFLGVVQFGVARKNTWRNFPKCVFLKVPYVNDEYLSQKRGEISHYYLGARWISHLRSTLGVRSLTLLNIKNGQTSLFLRVYEGHLTLNKISALTSDGTLHIRFLLLKCASSCSQMNHNPLKFYQIFYIE